MSTFMANKATVDPKWYVIDATNQVVGRLAPKGAASAATPGSASTEMPVHGLVYTYSWSEAA